MSKECVASSNAPPRRSMRARKWRFKISALEDPAVERLVEDDQQRVADNARSTASFWARAERQCIDE